MSRVLQVEILGDASSAERAFKKAAAAAEGYNRTVAQSATANVDKAVKQRDALEQLSLKYRELAASAQKGSREQVAAANLATEAEKKLAGQHATTAAEARRLGESTARAERETGKLGRGALAGTGIMRGFGRSIAFASSSFIGAAGLVAVTRSSVTAAEDLNVATRRLQVVVDNLSLGYKAHSKEISKALTAEEKLSAFTKQDLTDSLGKLIPATHNVGQGLKDVALAADLARGRNIDLQTATMMVVKAQEGNVAALKRMGIAITPVKDAQNALTDSHKHFTTEIKAQAKALDAAATSHAALAQLQKTYGGNAKVDTTETQKFKDEIHQLEVAVGQGLLPSIDKLLPQLTKWLGKNVDAAKVTRDVKTAVHDATEVFKTAKGIIEGVDDVTGGFKHTLELLLALKVLSVLSGWAGGFLKLGGAAGIGGAESAAGGLLTKMGLLKALGPIALEVTLTELIVKKYGSGWGNALSAATQPGATLGGGVAADVFQGNNPWPVDSPNYFAWQKKHGIIGNGGPGSAASTAGSPGRSGAAVYSPSDVHSLLLQQGATPQEAAYLTYASRTHEDPSGATAALNDNKRTHDYSVGLFQINFRDMHNQWMRGGPAAAAKLAQDPAAQARYALSILRSQGAGAWPTSAGMAGSFGLGGSGGGSGSGGSDGATTPSIAALLAQGTTKPKHVHTISGLKLLPQSMQLALDKAMGTKGLGDDTSALRNAITFLQHDTSGGKLEVAHELGILQKSLNGVDKAVAAQVKAKHQALLTEIQKIKSSYSAQISAGKSAIGTAFSQVQTDLDTAFQAQTQAYIDKVLGPKYSQGSMTPLEAKLAGMQTADKNQSLQDTLDAAKKQLGLDQNGTPLQSIYDDATGKTSTIYSGAGPADQIATDQKAVEAAQRAIDEDTLATQATAERAQADKDYAAAVTQYTTDRTEQERQLNVTLAQFGKGLQDGKVTVGQLNDALVPFGVSLADVPAGQLKFDMDDLSTAVQALSATLIAEAIKLGGVGGPGGAAATAIAASNANLRQLPGGMIVSNSVVGHGLGGSFGMAAGGILMGPTVIGGEAGKEAVIPLESPRALSMIAGALGGGDTVVHTHVYMNGREFFTQIQKAAARDMLSGGKGVPGVSSVAR